MLVAVLLRVELAASRTSCSVALCGRGRALSNAAVGSIQVAGERILAGSGGHFQTGDSLDKDQVPERPLGQTQQRLYAVRSTFDRL